jgi:pilus assembly protein CpaD
MIAGLASCADVWGSSMIEPFLRLACLGLMTYALAACAPSPYDFNARTGDEAALRHPIELRQGWQELVLPAVGSFDDRSRMQISEFVADWRRSGGGPVYVRLPNLGSDDKKLQAQFARLRAALVAEGLTGHVTLLREPVASSSQIPNFVLSFARIKAQLVTNCGQWPNNLASSAATNWDNRVHADFGCAYQNMIAVQTADPRDLVAPHPQSAIDAQMRVRALSRLRSEDSGAAGGSRN